MEKGRGAWKVVVEGAQRCLTPSLAHVYPLTSANQLDLPEEERLGVARHSTIDSQQSHNWPVKGCVCVCVKGEKVPGVRMDGQGREGK